MSRTWSRFSESRAKAGSIQLFRKIKTTAAANPEKVAQIDSPKFRTIALTVALPD